MPKPLRLFLLTAILATAASGAVQAESLSCQSINGNINCAGRGAMSCQTVNGRTTCVGGNGAIVQQFGSAPRSAPMLVPDEAVPDDDGPDEEAIPMPRSRGRMQIERRGPAGWMTIERDGSRLRLRSDRLSIDRD